MVTGGFIDGRKEVGIDIVSVDRIRKSCERYGEQYLKRILTENEISCCRKKADMMQSVSARFAAKEALSKALGSGIGKSFGWHSVEILNEPNGRPFVRICDNGCGIDEATIRISLSHDRHYAVAIIMIDC